MTDYNSIHSGATIDSSVTKANKLPTISSGDAQKSIKIKADETGYEAVDEYSDSEIDSLLAGKSATTHKHDGVYCPLGGVKGSIIGGGLEFSSSTVVFLNSSAYHHDGTTEQMVYWNSKLSKTFTGLSNSTLYYIYLDDSAIVTLGAALLTANEITYSTDAPVYSQSKHGWYNGEDRCIGQLFTDSSGDIIAESLHSITENGWDSDITIGSVVSVSGETDIDYVGIPFGVKEISINMADLTITGTSDILIQIGTSSGIESTGYQSVSSRDSQNSHSETGFCIFLYSATTEWHGTMVLSLLDPDTYTWICSGSAVNHDNSNYNQCNFAGSKDLSGVLTSLRVTRNTGTDTFTSGKINISYK